MSSPPAVLSRPGDGIRSGWYRTVPWHTYLMATIFCKSRVKRVPNMLEIQDRWVTFYPPEGATYLIGDFTDWDDKLIPLSAAVTYEFPRGAYVEYAYFDAHKQPMADPTNPVRPKHPWHDFDRAVTLPLNDFKAPPRPHAFRGHVYDHQ